MVFLQYYLWIAPHILLGICLWLFLRQGLGKKFPIFATYMVAESVDFLALFLVTLLWREDPAYALNVYRWIMVWGLGIISLLSFGVIYELVKQVILSGSTLAKTLESVIRWSAAVLLLLTAVASAQMGISVERVMNVFGVLDFSTSVLQVGLLLVLFLFSRILRVSWRSLPAGIAIGLGILGCAELATAPMFSVFAHRHATIDLIRLSAFHACVLVWLGYLIFPDSEPKFPGGPLRAEELESWNQEVQKMVPR
jgi:hypothetical protein